MFYSTYCGSSVNNLIYQMMTRNPLNAVKHFFVNY
jgi:hypothetical protein